MQLCHNYFGGGYAFFFMYGDRNTAAIIRDRARAVCMQGDFDVIGVAGEGFINRMLKRIKMHV